MFAPEGPLLFLLIIMRLIIVLFVSRYFLDDESTNSLWYTVATTQHLQRVNVSVM